MSSFEDFENTQKEMYEEIIEILKEDPDLGQYTDQILDPIGYQAEYIRHQQQKIDKLEAANKVLVEAVEFYANAETSWEGSRIILQDKQWLQKSTEKGWAQRGKKAREALVKVKEIKNATK